MKHPWEIRDAAADEAVERFLKAHPVLLAESRSRGFHRHMTNYLKQLACAQLRRGESVVLAVPSRELQAWREGLSSSWYLDQREEREHLQQNVRPGKYMGEVR